MNEPQRHELPVYAMVPRKEEQMYKQLIKTFSRGGFISKLHIMKKYLAFIFAERKIFQNEFNVCIPTR